MNGANRSGGIPAGRAARVLASIAGLLLGAAAAAEIAIDAPRSGWTHSGGAPMTHLQDVHYPASRVNAGRRRVDDEGRDRGAAIRGRILQPTKTSGGKPQLLVVNGVPMPLAVGPDGRFARPYAFPPGANSLEIRSADRRAQRRVHFYDNASGRPRVGLRIVLSWDTDQTDVDLHVISPDGQHVFWGRRMEKNGGALDVDVTGGYGPEIYAIVSPPRGVWQVYVNYFGGWAAPDSGDDDAAAEDGGSREKPVTVAQLAIVSHEGTPDEKRQIVRVPLRRPGDLTLVRSFVFP